MTAPTIVNAANTNGGSGITKPATGTTGDFYVVGVYTENAATPSAVALSGFTSVGESHVADTHAGGIVGTVVTFWRVYDGSEGATFSPSGLGAYSHYVACIIRGADTAITPLSNALNHGLDPLSVTGLTTVYNDSLGLIWWSMVSGGATAPNNTLDSSVWASVIAPFDSNTGWFISRTLTTAGATGAARISFDDQTDTSQSHGGMIAFAPAGSSGGPARRKTGLYTVT